MHSRTHSKSHSRRHSRNVSSVTAERYQTIAYLRRKPGLTKAQFYDHWQNIHAKKVAPWAEKHGIISYKQVHTSGTIIPNFGTEASDDDPITTGDLIQPVKFDGIAMFELPAPDTLVNALKDSYYAEVIEPDEHKILDKEGLGGGIVAKFDGKVVTAVDGGKALVGREGEDETRIWAMMMGRKGQFLDAQDYPDM